MISQSDCERYPDSTQVTGKHFCIAPSQIASSLLPHSSPGNGSSNHFTSSHLTASILTTFPSHASQQQVYPLLRQRDHPLS